MNKNTQLAIVAEWFLRIALAIGFLSAVADRLGIWGPPGATNVAWGSWEPFVEYVGILNWFAPASMHSVLAWIATIAEIVIAVGLLVGWKLRWFAYASSLLLLIFAVTMMMAHGIKTPLDYSVLTASAASLLLAIGRNERESNS